MSLRFYYMIIFFCACWLGGNAQFKDRYWAIGDSAAIDFSNLNNPVAANSILQSRGTCVSICDSLGSLLFYASDPHVDLWLHVGPYNYGYVVNKNHVIMENGDSLVGLLSYQEMVIIPDPSDNNRFYLIQAGIFTSVNAGIYYSIIDLSYNSGLGRVVQKNIQLNSLPITDGIAAVKHGNGRDWWFVAKHWDTPNNDFYLYLITPAGLSGPYIQSIGTSTANNITKMKFSKDGHKLFIVNPVNLIESFDFDRCSGQLSNQHTIVPQSSSGPYNNEWGFAISPSATKLYTSSVGNGTSGDTSYLFQYDLTAANIAASKDTIYTTGYPYEAGMLQPGPDDKVYFSSSIFSTDCIPDYLYCDTTWFPENMNIGVINSPDSSGLACNFQPYSFYLGGHRSYLGLPNNPNYELGPDTNSICDTVTEINYVTANETSESKLFAWYGSEWKALFINAQNFKGKHFRLIVFDLAGKIVYSETGTLGSKFFTRSIHGSDFSKGLYVVQIITEFEKSDCKFVVQ